MLRVASGNGFSRTETWGYLIPCAGLFRLSSSALFSHALSLSNLMESSWQGLLWGQQYERQSESQAEYGGNSLEVGIQKG